MRKILFCVVLLGVYLMAGLWEIVVPFTSDDLSECTNPSLETNLTSHAASGSNTHTRSTDFQYRGAYSLKSTYQDNLTLDTYTHTFLNASTTYYVKVKVYVPANWNGTMLSISSGGNYSGATITPVTTWTTGGVTATWVELKSTFALASDVAGTITVVTTGTPTAGRFIYLDAFYISTNDGLYFDGDEPSGFSFWKGNRHASASQMDYRNRGHGQAVNLDSYNVFCGHAVGLDFPPMKHNTRPRALGRGGEYTSTTYPVRAGSLPIAVVGSSEANYHSLKKTFENVVKPNTSVGNQEFTLRSLAANSSVPNNLNVRMDGDLSLVRSGFTGNGLMRLLATNPPWYEAQDRYASLTRSSSLSVKYILGWLNDGTGFSNLGGNGTTPGTSFTGAIAENGDLYIGGDFLNWEGIADADRFAKYTRSTGVWSAPLTSGANNDITKIIILDDGNLVIVGDFTSIGGSALTRGARWDGTTLSGFGTGFNSIVYDVAFDYKRGILYFVGGFTTANGVANCNRVCRYTLSTGVFTAMDSGANDAVRTIHVDQASGDVYIGGDFTTVGGTPLTVNYIARWDYSDGAWKVVGKAANPGTSANVYAITSSSSGVIYIGGGFTSAGGNTANYIAQYVPFGQIKSLGGLGANNTVQVLYWDKVLSKLFVGGTFTSIGGLTVEQMAYFNGTTFEKLAWEMPGNGTPYFFARHVNGDYYVGFDGSGTIVVPSALNSVTNSGTDETYPIFYFFGKSGNIGTDYATLAQLGNRTTGAVINFNDLRLLVGAEVIVDIEKGKVFRRVGQTLEDITAGVFRRDSDLAAFALTPGLNQILVAAPDTVGTPTIIAYVLYRHRHWSISGVAT